LFFVSLGLNKSIGYLGKLFDEFNLVAGVLFMETLGAYGFEEARAFFFHADEDQIEGLMFFVFFAGQRRLDFMQS
jgi:hypothetical protein